MTTLDATQQRLLEKAPDNPSSPKKPEGIPAARPGLGFSKSTTGPPKPSLRETMLAQKKAVLASKTLPARPGSAMSSFSPMRTLSSSSTASTMSAASDAGPVRPRPESATVSHGGLSVAPMRPTKFRRPEMAARPATAGPYSVRRPGHAPSNSDSISPSAARTQKTRTPSSSSTSPPKKPTTRPNTSHTNQTSSSHTSPAKSTINRVVLSPRASPAKPKSVANLKSNAQSSSPSKAEEDFTLIAPSLTGLSLANGQRVPEVVDTSNDDDLVTPLKSLKVYEDPFSTVEDQTTPKPTFKIPVLGEVPVNEDAANLLRNHISISDSKLPPISAERFKQNSRLIDSGIAKIKTKSLDVHGFRKLQGMIRDNKATRGDNKFEVLLLGLFEYLEAPLASLTPEKVQDVKAQALATIKLMYKKDREAFRAHVPKCLESLLATRSCYDARAHIVSGLELLADELVTLADAKSTMDSITAQLHGEQMTLKGCRTLSMGLHILKELIDVKKEFVPSEKEISEFCNLATRCLGSSESGGENGRSTALC